MDVEELLAKYSDAVIKWACGDKTDKSREEAVSIAEKAIKDYMKWAHHIEIGEYLITTKAYNNEPGKIAIYNKENELWNCDKKRFEQLVDRYFWDEISVPPTDQDFANVKKFPPIKPKSNSEG